MFGSTMSEISLFDTRRSSPRKPSYRPAALALEERVVLDACCCCCICPLPDPVPVESTPGPAAIDPLPSPETSPSARPRQPRRRRRSPRPRVQTAPTGARLSPGTSHYPGYMDPYRDPHYRWPGRGEGDAAPVNEVPIGEGSAHGWSRDGTRARGDER